jgi:hypothetical protein
MGAVAITASAQEDDEQRKRGTVAEILKEQEALLSQIPLDPDTSSPNWKLLTEDVGLMVRADDQGMARARLFLLVEQRGWVPLAVDGPIELVPKIMLLEP